ncbi:hypothetical protein [Streptomyces sp. JB150]|uniref:hypothetical protein n=1 Tax=Streptomyces sp. JB150 TaxID=2714844 RepID=UPI001408ED04|nr:hypothetical protein [Streptomyces sp. JB150]QIJ60743.1 hypothetical protein G7Z13_00845 [Streptomyces sp. JB150]
MPRTTPPRPLDVEAVFPELTALRRTATRLHPRRGTPTVRDSSVGGPMLWPADEPWPACAHAHQRGSGHRYAEVVRAREILERAWRRDPRSGPNAGEADELSRFKRGRHAPHLADTDPIPLIGVAQLYRRDVPGLPDTGAGDVLQVFWCPFERHGESGHEMHVELRWRHSRGIGTPLAEQPFPEVVGRPELVPSPCVLHPEAVVEYPWFEDLPEDLRERIEAWETPREDGHDQAGEEGEGGVERYAFDLSTAPGWKVGGCIAWNLTGPTRLTCPVCAARLTPLLTVDRREWDAGTTGWIPDQDRDAVHVMDANVPTGVSPGRGRLIIAVCPRDPHHPFRLVTQ